MSFFKNKSEQQLALEIELSNEKARTRMLSDRCELQEMQIVDLYGQNQDLKEQVNNYKRDNQGHGLDSPFIGLLHLEYARRDYEKGTNKWI